MDEVEEEEEDEEEDKDYDEEKAFYDFAYEFGFLKMDCYGDFDDCVKEFENMKKSKAYGFLDKQYRPLTNTAAKMKHLRMKIKVVTEICEEEHL